MRFIKRTVRSFGNLASIFRSLPLAGCLLLALLAESPEPALAAEGPLTPPPGRDTLGEAELEPPGGPTFESVSSHYPALKYPDEAVGVPEALLDVLVKSDASLVFGKFIAPPKGAPVFVTSKACFTVGGAASRFGLVIGLDKCTKRLLDGSSPIIVANCLCDGLPCEQTILGWSPEMSPDTPQSVCLQLKVTNSGAASRHVPVQFVTDKPVATWDLTLAPGKSETVHLEVSMEEPNQAKKIDAAQFDQRLAEATAAWKALLGKGMKINVPEQRVNDACRAWLAYNFLDVDKQTNGVYEPHDGTIFYEAVFGYSASRYCHALDLWGYPEEARRYLDSILTFVSPEGLLVKNYGLPDTGAQLWAMGRHYQMTRDQAWLRKVAPTMLKMCDWIIGERKKSMASQESNVPWRGLIKAKPYCDEAAPAYSYHSDTYLALGLQETAAALRDVGMTSDGERLQKESDTYQADILTSMDRATIEHDGMRMLPIFPETQALLKRVNYTAADYYSLVSSMVLETGILPADSHQARLITDLMRLKGGLCLGNCAWGIGIDHAYSYGYLMTCLERSEVDRVILGFYTFLAYGMSRNTYAGVELTGLRSGENTPCLPHLYSGTQQLLLLRNMLVREEHDTLLLGQAIPRQWQEPGKKIEVRDAPTLFGKINYTMEAAADGKGITVRLDPPTDRKPNAIRIYLRDPQRRPIKSATINGAASKDFADASLNLAKASGPVVAEVRYE